MPESKPRETSIRSRLRYSSMATIAVFVVISLLLIGSFVQVRDKINEVVGPQLSQTLEHSRISREMAQFLARQKLLATTFYGDDKFLVAEGHEQQQLLATLTGSLNNQALRTVLAQLEGSFAEYLLHCRDVNELIAWRNRQGEAIGQTLSYLESVITELITAKKARGADFSSLQQLMSLVPSLRLSMLEIAKLNAEDKHQRLLYVSHTDSPPRSAELLSFSQQLKVLLTAEAPIDSFARHLNDQVAFYQHLMKRYQQELIHLGKTSTALNQQAAAILSEMARLDEQSTIAAQQIGGQVEQTISTTGLIVLTLMGVLILLLWWLHYNLFRKHIRQPMTTIQNRLIGFREGDYTSPMPLDRFDEWGEIESVFNDMLADLVKSWSSLQESERRYREIFYNASEGIFQSSLDNGFLEINPAMANILGYDSADEAIAELTDLAKQLYLQPGFRAQLIEKLRVAGNVKNVEARLVRRSGEVFWASINAHLVRDEAGNESFIEGTLEDVSTRRAAEESLRQLQRYLQNIIDSMPSILIGIDINCQVTLWNKQAEQLCDLSALHAKGQSLSQVFKLFSADLYLPSVMETLRTREPQRLLKLLSDQQGQQRYFNLLIYPLTTTEASGAVIHIDEVSERVKIEEVMVQSEKMLSVGGLAAGMAHEINNPLAAILQNAQVLRQRLSPALDKNCRIAEELGFTIEQLTSYVAQRGIAQMLQSITDSGQKAAKIVENMLTFSRKSCSNFIPRSLAYLVEQALVLAASDYDMKHKFDFRSVAISRDFAVVPNLPCDASQIQQVIFNLLKNTAHALGEQSDKPQIHLRIFQQEQMLVLQVEDNGPGISADLCKRIFEPFYTTKEVGTGTGLGLSVAYFIVTENHQGQLSVESEVGSGSCFTLSLPLKTE